MFFFYKKRNRVFDVLSTEKNQTLSHCFLWANGKISNGIAEKKNSKFKLFFIIIFVTGKKLLGKNQLSHCFKKKKIEVSFEMSWW